MIRFLFFGVVCFGYFTVNAVHTLAQGRITDTLRVVGTSIEPGDTGAVYIYIANADSLGGYTLRFRFDPNVLGIVTLPGDDSTAEAVQLRGDFKFFRVGYLTPGVVSLVAAFPIRQEGLVNGSGNTVRFRLFVRPNVLLGTVSEIFFEDAPYDSNANNWFSHWTGLYQYRPTRVPGFIIVGEGASLLISCPMSTPIACDESSDPARTGQALASDPAATVTYRDETTSGFCAGESTIRRTWSASLGGQDTSCVQIIFVRDTAAPAVNCPPTKNVEFGLPTDPARTGYPTVIDNCDPLPNVTYGDTETPGTYPVHRLITRTWTAADACGNRDVCRQLVRELAEGVPDSTIIDDGDEQGLILHPLWPNPFHLGRDSADSVRYTIAHAGRVKISIYDVAGRRLKTLLNELIESPGTYTTSWTGKDAADNYVPSGVYICRLELDGKAVKQKVAVIR